MHYNQESKALDGGKTLLSDEMLGLPATVTSQECHCRGHRESNLAFQQIPRKQEPML